MSQTGEDAQRDMEQRALRNVRGLLDKIEGQEKADRWTVRKLVVVLGILLVAVVVTIAALSVVFKKPKGTAITVPPQKTAPK